MRPLAGLLLPLLLQDPALSDPKAPAVNLTAPAEFRVKLETTKGDLVLKVMRDWAPKGADRFYSLVKNGYYDECRFYRVLPKYIAQVGIHGDPKISAAWREAKIEDDPVKEKNTRGRVTFAKGGPNSRTTNLFINLRDNPRLDSLGFVPIGRVVKGMAVADRLYAGYGERPMAAANTARLYGEANAFLDAKYPKLDRIRKVTVRAR